jgi:hypothetical protein|tara:strand:+ start:1118 stop:1669 length:552 start_codon:yes stop_codon:yes gene_type:complete
MRKIKKIFVVLEAQQEKQPALVRATYIAEATGASLHLFMCAYDTAIGIASFLSGTQKSSFIQTVVDGSRVMVGRLAAIDAAPESQFHISLNAAIMDRASYLARQLDFELHVVSAYPPPPVFVPLTKAYESLAGYRSKMSNMVESNLKSLGEKYGVLGEHQHPIEGPVDWVIPKVSKDLVADSS